MPDETVWEERVIALEAQVKDRDALLSDQSEAIVEQTAKIAGLSATVEALNAAEQTRTAAATTAYMAKIKSEACEAGSPISAEDLAKVEAQFEAGNEELAKTLGGAFLDRSRALGAGAVGGSETKTVTLGVTDAQQEQHDAEMAAFSARWNIKSQSQEA